MTGEQTSLFTEYVTKLTLQKRPTANAVYSLKKYFRYIEAGGINFLRMGIREAGDFQVDLSTSAGKNGSLYSRSNVLMIMGFVSSFYDFLKAKKLIYANPFKEIARVKQVRSLPRNILKEDEMIALLRSFRRFMEGATLHERKKLYRAHVIAELMYATGARIHEIMNLTIEDIDFSRGTVRITDTKTKNMRESLVNSYALRVLELFVREMRDLVLPAINGACMDRLFGSRYNLKGWMNEMLSRESEKLGLKKITAHSIRHSVGYHLLKNGCDIRYIQEIMGHRKLSSTQVYTRVEKDDLKQVLDRYHPRRFIREKP